MGESRESMNHAWKFDKRGWSEPQQLRAHTVFAEDRVGLPAPTKVSSQPPLTPAPVASTSSRSHVLMPTHTETHS